MSKCPYGNSDSLRSLPLCASVPMGTMTLRVSVLLRTGMCQLGNGESCAYASLLSYVLSSQDTGS